jgi:hypothetical protein
MEILRSPRRQLIQRNAPNLRQTCRSMNHQGRLIPLPPVRNRSQKGRIRLDQNPISRSESRRLSNQLSFRVSEIPSEGEIEPQIERPASVINGAREAMHNAAQTVSPPVLINKRKNISPRISRTVLLLRLWCSQLRRPAVNDDRLAHARSNLHLRNKGPLLRRNVRIAEMVVVQTNLSNRNTARLQGQAFELSQRFSSSIVRLLWMNPRARINLRKILPIDRVRKIKRLMHLGRTFTDANSKNSFDPGRERANEDLIAFRRVVVVEIKVRVGVDKMHSYRLRLQRPERNRNSATTTR